MVESGTSDALLRRLKTLFRSDREHSAEWRRNAKEDFDFAAGDQWDEKDREHLKSLMRPVITFNRTLPIINSVSGQEMASKSEVRYMPREMGDAKPNEVLTEGARWFRDLAEADDEDSEAFQNAIICGMGWTETTLDYEEDPEGIPRVESVSPLEMFWDRNARKKNLTDAERVWRLRKMSRARARQLFPSADITELDARWADPEIDVDKPESQEEARRYEGTGEAGEEVDVENDDRQVTIVHCQWIERQDFVRVADWAGQVQEMSAADYRKGAARAKQVGLPFAKVGTITKRKVRQAFLGAAVLEQGDALCNDHFSYQCITAYQHKTKGTFFGLVQQMKDPQRWANRWLSQALDILNSQAKGGVVIEKDATDDMKEFEKTWARPDKPTYVPRGFLSGANGPKMIPKPGGQFPAGFMQLMEFAISSVRDATGVSVEMLGMREADQPASLEFQRRQAGMLILQPLLKNLRRYLRETGKVMLYLIQSYLSDGRLVRVVGDEGAKYVPLALHGTDAKYDIIVDESPTSPNQKEAVWSMIGERFWELPPEIQSVLLEYSPFPTSIVEKVREAGKAGAEQAAQTAQMMAQLEGKLKEADAMLKAAQAQKAGAEAQKITSEIGKEEPRPMDPVDAHGLEVARMQTQAELDAQKLALERDLKVLDAQLKAQVAEHSMTMAERKAALDRQMMIESAMQKAKPNEEAEEAGERADIVAPIVQGFERVADRMAQASIEGSRIVAQSVTDAIKSGSKRIVRDPKTDRVMGVEPVFG